MNTAMNEDRISGVYAAVLTPRLASGAVDSAALEQLIGFLLSKGISSFAVNGATGEFCLTTAAHLRVMLRTIVRASEGRAHILCGVGSAGSAGAIELAAIAQQEGAFGLLLPMPYFFSYQQEDLDRFCRAVAASTELPVLLYNLPQFGPGLEKETVQRLIREVPNIVGIKDSSGALDILRNLSSATPGARRMVGNDGVLAQALTERACDGVVSGVACALPELVLEIYSNKDRPNTSEFLQASRVLQEFIARLEQFPTPWGLKWAVEARGVIAATFSQPLTPHRLEQGREFVAWIREWLPSAMRDEPAPR